MNRRQFTLGAIKAALAAPFAALPGRGDHADLCAGQAPAQWAPGDDDVGELESLSASGRVVIDGNACTVKISETRVYLWPEGAEPRVLPESPEWVEDIRRDLRGLDS